MGESHSSSSPLSEDEVQEFVQDKSEILKQTPDLNEEEVKTAVITDFVELLGWQIPIHLRRRHPARASRGGCCRDGFASGVT